MLGGVLQHHTRVAYFLAADTDIVDDKGRQSGNPLWQYSRDLKYAYNVRSYEKVV